MSRVLPVDKIGERAPELLGAALLWLPETVMLAGFDAMPFATTTSVLGPESIIVGTSKYVQTSCEPVATPMEL